MIFSDKILWDDRPKTDLGVRRGDNLNKVVNSIITAQENRFTPADLLNLWAWYESTHGVTVTDGVVTRWNDKSQFGRDLLEVGVGPEYRTEFINLRPALVSKEGWGYLVTSQSIIAAPDITIYVVGLQGNSDGPQRSFVESTNDEGFYFQVGRNDGIEPNLIGGHIQGTVYDYAYRPARVNKFYTMRFRSNASEYGFALNGGDESVKARGSSSAQPSLVSLFNYGNKAIAEVIICLRRHDDATAAQVEKYLRNKYRHY